MPFQVQACPARKIKPGDPLLEILHSDLPPFGEGTLIAITSKIVSLCHNRIVSKDLVTKRELIHKEAEAYLETEGAPTLTMKQGLLMPASGIDESNSEWGYILHPERPFEDAALIWEHLRSQRAIKNLGILITDSRTSPLRRGVTGVALAWCGFSPFHDYIGQPDLYGSPLKVTVSNVVDALAAAAVLAMGEADEQTPAAILQGAPKVCFLDRPATKGEIAFMNLRVDEDIYGPILKAVSWKRYESK